MFSSALKQLINSQDWLDSVGDPLQKYVNDLFSRGGERGKKVQNFLNGVWLGHPLHPVVTDVPVGAWTCTLLLDSLSSSEANAPLAAAADLTLATGLAAAYASAATGLTDWKDTYAEERKVGLAHGLMMLATTSLYSLALLARLSGARRRGVGLANLAYALLALGAYIGGEEVYDIGYGVNRTAFQHEPEEYMPAVEEAQLEPEKPHKAAVAGVDVLLVKHDGTIYALDDVCVHAGCSLSGGKLSGRSIICPCHASQYDLADGSVINGPATMPEPSYDVRVREGMVEVKLSS